MQLDPLDDAVRAVLLTRESYDYFDLEALRAGVVLERRRQGSLTLDLHSDRYRTLTKVARRGLLTTPHDFRANPAIDEGRAVLLRASYLRDTRDVRDGDGDRAPASWERVVVEHADRAWGGDFTFSRAEVELGVRSPLSPLTRLDYRLRAGAGSATMPVQQRFFAGGAGTLRGYPVKAAGGNALWLVSAEATTDITRDIRALAFADAGTAWQDWKTLGSQKLLVSAGVGVGLGGLTRAYLARAWSAPGRPWSVRVVLRSAFARPTAGLDAVQP